jgi:hypothetical protein
MANSFGLATNTCVCGCPYPHATGSPAATGDLVAQQAQDRMYTVSFILGPWNPEAFIVEATLTTAKPSAEPLGNKAVHESFFTDSQNDLWTALTMGYAHD